MEKKYITLSYDAGRVDGPWFLSTSLVKPPKGKGDYETLKIVKGKPAELNFRIETNGIKFSVDNPIEISLIANQDPPGDLSQFPLPKGGEDKLTVEDANTDQTPTDYYYKLNFDNGTSLDPIIQNGCCRMSLVSESSAFPALLLAALVILLTALHRRWAKA